MSVGLKARAGRAAGDGASSRDGFTLLEVVLALGLIGLIATVLIISATNLTTPKAKTAEDVFWKAVAESRKEALLTGREVRLRFMAEKKKFALVSIGPAGVQEYSIENYDDVKIDFLTAQKGASAILIASQLVETQTIPYVTFYGDGTCTPFRLQVRTGGPARTIAIDPWTCAQMLTSNDRNS